MSTMGTMSASAPRRKRVEAPKALVAGLRQLDRLIGSFESPLAQVAVIVLAAALATVLGTALIRALAGAMQS